MEFKSFSEIKKYDTAQMVITQKIHGTNAQIVIFPYTSTNGVSHETRMGIKVGSRTRWIAPGDDNYGFAAFVYANKEAFIECLGEGTWYGEWCGPGINSGEGLTQKTFVLFDWWRFKEDSKLPPQTVLVPVLYRGNLDSSMPDKVMEDLKTNGSKLAPGFMRSEGVVITIGGARFKKVFDAEETAWTEKPKSGNKGQNPRVMLDVSHLLQPIRLEKLLSRDEIYLKNYPKSLPQIAKEYVADLTKEGQFTGNEEENNGIRKSLSGPMFKFIQHEIETKHAEYLASKE